MTHKTPWLGSNFRMHAHDPIRAHGTFRCCKLIGGSKERRRSAVGNSLEEGVHPHCLKSPARRTTRLTTPTHLAQGDNIRKQSKADMHGCYNFTACCGPPCRPLCLNDHTNHSRMLLDSGKTAANSFIAPGSRKLRSCCGFAPAPPARLGLWAATSHTTIASHTQQRVLKHRWCESRARQGMRKSRIGTSLQQARGSRVSKKGPSPCSC